MRHDRNYYRQLSDSELLGHARAHSNLTELEHELLDRLEDNAELETKLGDAEVELDDLKAENDRLREEVEEYDAILKTKKGA